MFPGASTADAEATYTILGAGLERTTTGRSGAREGPRVLRTAAAHFEDYDPDTDAHFTDLGVSDAGDVGHAASISAYLDVLETELRRHRSEGRVPLTLGGEHTVTVGAVRALEPTTLVVLDAHLDLRDEYAGARLHHATTVRRCLDIVDHAVIVGARSGAQSEWNRAEADDVTVIGADELDRFEAIALEDCYLSVDIDIVDPSFAPATGTPEPFGLTPKQVRSLVRTVAPKATGMDLVEVSDRDAGQTAVLGAKLLRRFVYDHAAATQT